MRSRTVVPSPGLACRSRVLTWRARSRMVRKPRCPGPMAVGSKPGSVVGDGHLDGIPEVGDRDACLPGTGMLDRVVQRLQGDPVGLFLGGCRDRRPFAGYR